MKMLDTVILRLEPGEFRIKPEHYDNFSISARHFVEPPFIKPGRGKAISCHLNPTPEQKRKGQYLPKLTLTRAVRCGGHTTFLRIEFSAPKIIFNNNLDELKDGDFVKVCEGLAQKLDEMGVIVPIEILKVATVAAIHYGKNIVYDDNTRAVDVVDDFSKLNISKRHKVSKTTYENDGSVFHGGNTQWNLALYDKVAEMKRGKISEKGCQESDMYCQLDVLDNPKLKAPFEVVRLEIRYKNKQAIDTILRKINKQGLPHTFENLFSSEIARAALVEELNQFYGAIPSSASITTSANDIGTRFREFAKNNPGLSVHQKTKLFTIVCLAQEIGYRATRQMIKANSAQWSRIMKEVQAINGLSPPNTFATLRKQVEDFNPVKLRHYLRE